MAREATVKIAYVPFKTFLTALDTLRQGVPDPVDKSVFQNQSFSTQNMLISSLKALGALDDDGHPQEVLRRLVDPNTRKDTLRAVILEKYKTVFDLGTAASEKQVDDKFRELGVGGATLDKAKSFFLQATALVAIPLSPHLRGARTVAAEDGEPVSKQAAPTRRRRVKKEKNAGGVVVDPAPLNLGPRGSSKTIQLVSGSGEVTLSVTIDPMELDDDDRDFVFELIGNLKAYEKNNGPSANRGGAEDAK